MSIDPNDANSAYDTVVGPPSKPSKPRQLLAGDIVQLDPRYADENPGAKRAAQYVLTRNGPRPGTGRRNLLGRMVLPSGKLAALVVTIPWPVLCMGRWAGTELVSPVPTPAEVSAAALSPKPSMTAFLDTLREAEIGPEMEAVIHINDFVLWRTDRKCRLWVITWIAPFDPKVKGRLYGRRVSTGTGKVIESEFLIAHTVVKMVPRDPAPAPVSGANSTHARETDDGVQP